MKNANLAFSQKMKLLFGSAWTDLIDIKWNEYSSKIQTHDDSNQLKYQGMLLRIAGHNLTEAQSIFTFGQLTDKEKSLETVGNKIDSLIALPDTKSSLEGREPPRIWGGAVRQSDNPEKSAGITGLPELGDHLSVSYGMKICGRLTVEDCNAVLHPENNGHIRAAQELVGMSDENYILLAGLISTILMRHAVKVQIAA